MIDCVLYYKANLRNTGECLPFRNVHNPSYIYSWGLGCSSLAFHRGDLGRFLGRSCEEIGTAIRFSQNTLVSHC
jgi:hypothetical protein